MQAPFGLVKDLSVGAFTDDEEFDGFIGTIYGSITKRGGQLLGNVMGPEEGLGAAFGGLPEGVRSPIRAVTHPILEGLETAGREVIREPLTAALTAASYASAGKGWDFGKGYEIAQTRSLGQAFALAILTEDITDEAEVAEAMGTDWYQTLSGTMDAAARLFLDVDIVGGKVLKGFRGATVAGKAASKTVRIPKVAQRALKVGETVELPPGALEQVGAALYRHAPESLQRFGGKAIRGPADVAAAMADPRLNLINESFKGLKREEGILTPGERSVRRVAPEELETMEWGGEGAEPGLYAWDTNEPLKDLSRDLGDARGLDEPLLERVRREGRIDEPVVIDSDLGMLMEGHSRFLIAKELGMDLPVRDVAPSKRGTAAPPDPAAVDRVAARIRDLAFHDHRDGAIISRVLAEADDMDLAWGALMGHRPSVERMWAEQADTMGRISRLEGDQARVAQMERMVGVLGPDQLPLGLPDDVAAIRDRQVDVELDKLYDTESRLLHNEKANAMVQEMPRISGMSERRVQFTRSHFFQANPLAQPLRLAINMRPRNMIDLHDASGDAQVTRLLRKAGGYTVRDADGKRRAVLSLEEQDRLRGAYMAAADPTARNGVLAQVEGASIRALAQKYGITDAEKIQQMIDKASRGRAATMGALMQSRRYDGQGRSYIWDKDPDTGVAHKIYVPLSVTQEINHFLLPDLDQLEKVFARHGDEISRRGAVLESGGEFLEAFQRLWKPSVLLRVGWPIRVVGEEQIRIMSQIGALLTSGRTLAAGGRYTKDAVVDLMNNATQARKSIPRAERTSRGFTGEDIALSRGLRFGGMNIRGAEIESAFGTTANFLRQYRTLNSARSSFEHVVRNADDIRNGLRTEVLGEWQSLDPGVRGYGEAWEHAVNKQIGGDEVWRQFLEGRSHDEVRTWLDTTAAGRAYKKRMRHWRGREDDWLEFMGQTVNDYLPTEELRALALEGKARQVDLERAVPDAGGRPVIHGAALNDVAGRTRAAQAIGKLRDQAMKVLGGLPTDVLSRNNYFDYVYTTEVTRLVDLAADQGMDLTGDLLRAYEGKARNHALGKSKALLYDMADESELSHMLRFVSPFYSAWQEVTTRWTGIATQNPVFIARMHEVWRAPERMGIVTDENGATINEDGTATLRIGDKDETVEAGKDRYVNFKLLATDNVAGKFMFNDLTRNIPGVKMAENAKFNKKSANLILQGAPGVGPIIQIPINEMAKGRPEIEDSVKWALPFGATQSTLQTLLPATARRAQTLSRGEEDRLYRNQLLRIYWDMQVDYNLEKRAEKPSYGEAKKKTDDFYRLRTVASFVSPVAPSFQSPYQPYIDAYRLLKERDAGLDQNAPGYRSPDDIFLETYGDDFFPLTQSLSKTMDGIPPTLEGAAARQKYVDLIEKHPELGGLIIGADGAGEFSSAVYQSQLQKPVAPGSSDKQRQAFSFEDATAKPNERLGWIEFSKAMDLIDAERMNRGLPNLQVKQAADLRDLKNRVIRGLEQKYPEWGAEFNITDRGRWGRKIAGMREIAADERLAGRDEIRVLGEYLEARDVITDELAARKAAGGPSTLNAAGNMDLDGLWKRITAQLTDGNTAFSQLFYRYLERDPLDIEET